MVYHDPYTPNRSYYECRDCGRRGTASERPETCPECGGVARNIAVARE